MDKYMDKKLSSYERAWDLLSKMTLTEKVGQLNQRLYGFNAYERNNDTIEVSDELKKEVETFGGVGVLYGLYRTDPWVGKNRETGITHALSCKAYNTVQRYVTENSRLHIPVLVSTECPHGHMMLDGGLLPVNLACGCTFDTGLLEKAYRASGRELKDGKCHLALMSVLDILRDPRWGRSEECYSEDPYLSAKLAAAAVLGMESNGVYAVCKHLAAQGETTGGINASAARIGERELREIHLKGIKECVKSGAHAVMAAYNEIDGILCHENKKLLTDILRTEYGFKGAVMADGCAINHISETVGDDVKAAALALNAGVDISLWDRCFPRLSEALERGLIDIETLNRAVMRVLIMKFDAGLFDNPYAETNMLSSKEYGIDELSLQIAKESMVLLKNDNNVLPIKKPYRIAVVGAAAVSKYVLLGDYTPPMEDSAVITVLDGIREQAPEGTVICYVDSEEELEREYDFCMVFGGGSSSRYTGEVKYDINGAAIKGEGQTSIKEKKLSIATEVMDCGEGVDSEKINMQGEPWEIGKIFKKRGIPAIFIGIAGRPYAMKEVCDTFDGILWSFYPGPYGGEAIGSALFGKCNTTGRLSVSLPYESGQLPVYYNFKNSYRAMSYLDENRGAAYPFGFGLSYGTTVIKDCKTEFVGSEECYVKIHFTAENLSDMPDAVIAQGYMTKIGAPVTQRVKELKSFARIELGAYEKKSGVLTFAREEFSYPDMNMNESMDYDRCILRVEDRGVCYYETSFEMNKER